MNTNLLNNLCIMARNCTEGTLLLVRKGTAMTEFEVLERVAHRGRTGRTILTLKNCETSEVIHYGAVEILQNFGEKVYFCPSSTPLPTGTDGKKPESKKEAKPVPAANKAAKVSLPVEAAEVASTIALIQEMLLDEESESLEESEPVEASEVAEVASIAVQDESVPETVESNFVACEETLSIADILKKYQDLDAAEGN